MKACELLNTQNEIEITSITNDSRNVEPGALYVAIKGLTVDGHDFIAKAIENGAVAILHSEPVEEVEGIVYQQVEDIYAAYNQVSSKLWGNPASKMKVVGTTGTNGKSTTSWILDDILNRKYKSGYIGTVGIKTDDELRPSPFTTLLPHQYNQIFADMVANEKEYAIIEVSSQGLHQHRTDFIDFDYAIMTNLTHEHLDYHLTLENYLEAKALLFSQIKADGLAIINNDDDFSKDRLKELATGKIVTYGIDNESDVMAKDVQLFPDHSEYTVSHFGTEFKVNTNLVGRFNIYNLLAAITVALDCGVTVEELQVAVQNLSQVAGRMENLETHTDYNVIVDYAHTPDGFEQIFEYLKTITTGRVISVFGSAGERDQVKRPVLGEIAGRSSSHIILTEEDCGFEDPKQIADEIASGIVGSTHEYIANRELAIKKAIEMAEAGDTVAVLAKGQEQYLRRSGGKEFYEGDVNIAKNILANNKK